MTRHEASIPPMRGICRQSWGNSVSTWPGLVKDVMAAFALVLEWLHEKALVHEPDA
jgi:hypothetical protein